jgi:hypothetical protein
MLRLFRMQCPKSYWTVDLIRKLYQDKRWKSFIQCFSVSCVNGFQFGYWPNKMSKPFFFQCLFWFEYFSSHVFSWVFLRKKQQRKKRRRKKETGSVRLIEYCFNLSQKQKAYVSYFELGNIIEIWDYPSFRSIVPGRVICPGFGNFIRFLIGIYRIS